MRREARDRSAAERDAAAIRREQTGDQIEHGRLARAVGADQRVQRACLHDEAGIGNRLDAAECLREIARFQRSAVALGLVMQERRQRQSLLDLPSGHRRRLDNLRAHGLGEAAPHADEPRRRIDDEADEQQAEEQQPVRRPDREELAEEDEEQCAECGAEQAAHPADDHHREQFAGERHGDRIGRREPMVKHGQHTGEAAQRRRDRECDLLVALRGITDELRALLVLADRDQHRSDR